MQTTHHGGDEVIDERPERRERREENDIDDGHDRRGGDHPGELQVLQQLPELALGADVVDDAVDRREDLDLVQHRPHERHRDDEDDPQRDREQEGKLHDRPRVDPRDRQAHPPGTTRAGAPLALFSGSFQGHSARSVSRGLMCLPRRLDRPGRWRYGRSRWGNRSWSARVIAHQLPSSGVLSPWDPTCSTPSTSCPASASSESAASASSTFNVTAMMRSPSSARAKVTPWVFRPVRVTWSTAERTIRPFSMMTSTSSSSSVTSAPTRLPRASTMLATLIPSPPRFCTRYSLSAVRLA